MDASRFDLGRARDSSSLIFEQMPMVPYVIQRILDRPDNAHEVRAFQLVPRSGIFCLLERQQGLRFNDFALDADQLPLWFFHSMLTGGRNQVPLPQGDCSRYKQRLQSSAQRDRREAVSPFKPDREQTGREQGFFLRPSRPR